MTCRRTYPSKAEFDQAKQDKYKEAVAIAAGTTAANVEILSITDGRRRAGSVKVETKVSRQYSFFGYYIRYHSRCYIVMT